MTTNIAPKEHFPSSLETVSPDYTPALILSAQVKGLESTDCAPSPRPTEPTGESRTHTTQHLPPLLFSPYLTSSQLLRKAGLAEPASENSLGPLMTAKKDVSHFLEPLG